MKKIVLALIMLSTGYLTNGQSNNFGIGTSTPGTKLDVNGAITSREISVAVTNNSAIIDANIGQVQLTGTATAAITLTGPTPPNAGQRLMIFNNTTGGFPAILNGFALPSGQAMEYIYSNGGWQAMKFEYSKPQALVVETINAATMTKNTEGTTSIFSDDSLKINNIPGAIYDAVTNAITLPAGMYIITLTANGNYASGISDATTTKDGLKPIHSFFYDFPTGTTETIRTYSNIPANFGLESNFGVMLQYTTSITTPRTFMFSIGWANGGNVNTGKTYNFNKGTQMTFTKIQ